MTGTIKSLIPGKPFGFIAADDQKPGEKDTFFHKDSLMGITLEELKGGEKVSYDLQPSDTPDRGPKAINVKII